MLASDIPNVLFFPEQPYGLTTGLHHVHGGSLQILLHNDQVPTPGQLDKLASVEAQINDIPDPALCREHILRTFCRIG